MKTIILLVDDHAVNRKLLRVLLEEEGYEITEASNGSMALVTLKRNGIAAIILDLLMPIMDGYRFCEALRKFNHDIPIIVYTATHPTFSERLKAFESGATRVITKPDVESIIEALRELLPA